MKATAAIATWVAILYNNLLYSVSFFVSNIQNLLESFNINIPKKKESSANPTPP